MAKFGTIKLGWMPEYCMFGNTIAFEKEDDQIDIFFILNYSRVPLIKIVDMKTLEDVKEINI